MILQANNNKNITLLGTHHRRSLGCSLKRSHPPKYKRKEADNSGSPPNFCSARSSTLIQVEPLLYPILSRMVYLNERVRGPYIGV